MGHPFFLQHKRDGQASLLSGAAGEDLGWHGRREAAKIGTWKEKHFRRSNCFLHACLILFNTLQPPVVCIVSEDEHGIEELFKDCLLGCNGFHKHIEEIMECKLL